MELTARELGILASALDMLIDNIRDDPKNWEPLDVVELSDLKERILDKSDKSWYYPLIILINKPATIQESKRES